MDEIIGSAAILIAVGLVLLLTSVVGGFCLWAAAELIELAVDWVDRRSQGDLK